MRSTELISIHGENRSFLYDILLPGLISGVVGGAVLIGLYMAISVIFGQPLWTAPKVIAAVLMHNVQPYQMGAGAIVLGFTLHFIFSVGLATLYAALIPRGENLHIATTMLGILYALFMYGFVGKLLAAFIDAPFRQNIIYPAWFVGVLAWSVALGLVLPSRKLHHATA